MPLGSESTGTRCKRDRIYFPAADPSSSICQMSASVWLLTRKIVRSSREMRHRVLAGGRRRLSSGFEELDRIPVGILDLDLSPAGACFHLVAKTNSCLLQFGDATGKIRHFQHHAVPAARHTCAADRIEGHAVDQRDAAGKSWWSRCRISSRPFDILSGG